MAENEMNPQKQSKANSPIIFPLSPNPAMADSEQQIKVYSKYLNTAFNEPRISNIAVTGCYGVGKSSIIRSFERLRKLERKKQNSLDGYRAKKGNIVRSSKDSETTGFLYISLGAFATTDSRDTPTSSVNDGSTSFRGGNVRGGAETYNLQELNTIERRLLLQIYAHFRRKELPLSAFRLIREEVGLRSAISIACAIFACVISLLVFHDEIGSLFRSLPAPTTPIWLVQINNWFVTHREHILLLLYGFVIALFSIAVGVLSFKLLPHLRLSSISLKSNKAELTLEKEACGSYLDLYSMELVYCLTQIVDKIDSTVVFEDLDRLSPDIYIQIFTRLREINYLVNLRLARSNKHIRFVYAISDERLCKIEHHKFFDYILPIIPYLSQKSVEVVLVDRLNRINSTLGFQENNRIVNVARKVSPYLHDFRLQNTILNEYSLLVELYISNNQEYLNWERDASDIFAFSIYKSIWPEDYYKLCRNEDSIILNPSHQYFSGFDKQELFELLIDSSSPLLTSRCLYYAGFSEKEIADRRWEHWKNADSKEIIQDIDTIQAVDYENLKCVRKFCTLQTADEVVRAVIRCMVRCKQRNNQWFFSLDLQKCLSVLVAEPDERLKQEFFALSSTPASENIYITTAGRITGLSEITQAELKELCRGFVYSLTIYFSA